MGVFYENSWTLPSRDFDLFGQCRPSAVLGLLQEGAVAAADAIGLSGEELLRRYGAFWMLARVRYTLERPIRMGERVELKTWHRGGRAAVVYREYDLSVRGQRVGQALSAWVLAGMESRKILPLSRIEGLEDTSGGTLCGGELLHKLRVPEGLEKAGLRRMGYSDTDINGHVNNSRYADFLCDALRLEERGKGKFVSRLQLNYLEECLAGETVELYAGQAGEALFVHGQDPAGGARFDGNLTLDNLPRED